MQAPEPPLTLEQAQRELQTWVEREVMAHETRLRWEGAVDVLTRQQAAPKPEKPDEKN